MIAFTWFKYFFKNIFLKFIVYGIFYFIDMAKRIKRNCLYMNVGQMNNGKCKETNK